MIRLMNRPRLTFGKIACAWAVLLSGAALILPNLDLHTRSAPTIRLVIAIYWIMLMIGTPIALVGYFNRAWRRSSIVPNRGPYIAWLSLETIAAVFVVAMLFYATIAAVANR